jgi:ABC-type bacteriocin/lantibiotic exporter with double-glycine peptidase domain
MKSVFRLSVLLCLLITLSCQNAHYTETTAPSIHGTHYLQNDPRWASDTIGGSRETLSQAGCAISSVAMAASYLHYEISPKELNARLIQNNGYTARGWIIWSKVAEATDGTIQVNMTSHISYSEIDWAINQGQIPIVKFHLSNGAPHWAPIVGKKGNEYLIRDPFDQSKQVVPLSTRTNKILSVRYVTR